MRDSGERKLSVSPEFTLIFILLGPVQTSTERVRVPNLVPSIKYMKRSTFESVESNIFYFG